MASLTIPIPNDPIPEGIPMAMKIVKRTFGASTNTPDVSGSTAASTAAATLFTFPLGYEIHDVGWRVTQAFTNGVALTLGLDTDGDAFASAASVGGTDAADAHVNWMSRIDQTSTAAAATLPANFNGYLVESDASTASVNQNVIVNKAATAVDAGMLEVYVVYHAAFAQTGDTVPI